LTTYGANSLNQYETITNAGYQNILGAALATSAVTVNGGSTDRKGEYFHGEVTVPNSSGPLWQDVTVACGGTNDQGGVLSAGNRQSLTYDLDGNITFDGTWTYEWDGENRLSAMSMTNIANLQDTNRLRLQFAYDYQGHRISKTVKKWNGSSFDSGITSLFSYDGPTLLAILDGSSAIQVAFLWGQDLSGSIGGAGGVAGLLLETFNNQCASHAFAAYDGNGNITELVSDNPPAGARYEYNPYGQILRATGLMAHQNPFRFSTKFLDDETSLIYYGFRYYSPELSRWLNQDPAQESDGNNFYAFSKNSPINVIDTDGKISKEVIFITALAITINSWFETRISPEKITDLTEELHHLEEGLDEINNPGKKIPGRPTQFTRAPQPPRAMNAKAQRIGSWIRNRSGGWRGGGGAGLAVGALFLSGSIGMARAADDLASTFNDYARHVKEGETAWADLDAATFAAQLSGGGADYFFTMGVVDVLMTIGDYASAHQGQGGE
jgi:RHS repeat-associated protein